MVPSFLINIPQPPLLSWCEWVKKMMTTRNDACMKQFCETGTWSPPCTVEKPAIAHYVLSPVRPWSFYSTPNPWLHRKPLAEWWHFVAVSIQQFSMSLNGLPGACKLDTTGKSKKTWKKIRNVMEPKDGHEEHWAKIAKNRRSKQQLGRSTMAPPLLHLLCFFPWTPLLLPL